MVAAVVKSSEVWEGRARAATAAALAVATAATTVAAAASEAAASAIAAADGRAEQVAALAMGALNDEALARQHFQRRAEAEKLRSDRRPTPTQQVTQLQKRLDKTAAKLEKVRAEKKVFAEQLRRLRKSAGKGAPAVPPVDPRPHPAPCPMPPVAPRPHPAPCLTPPATALPN